MGRLTDADITSRLATTRWDRDGAQIVREFEFANFVEAVACVGRIAEVAEAANHHPDILIHGYRHVRLMLSTHSAGGLTEADFRLAGVIDGLVAQG